MWTENDEMMGMDRRNVGRIADQIENHHREWMPRQRAMHTHFLNNLTIVGRWMCCDFEIPSQVDASPR